jgi:CRP-like cAMP-binding protein
MNPTTVVSLSRRRPFPWGRELTKSEAGRGWPSRSFVGDLPDELRPEFLRLGAPRSFARGAVIVAENDHATEVYIILGGFVKVLNNTYGGDQAMIAIRTRGDLIGELAALDGKPRTSSVIAAGPTLVRVVDGLTFRSFGTRHPAAADAISRSVVGKLRTATRYRAENGQATVLTRVARVLEHLADGYGEPDTDGLLIDVPLPQHDMASLVGVSERSVYRAYEVLRRIGAIGSGYRRVVVHDLVLLHRYADGAVTPE